MNEYIYLCMYKQADMHGRIAYSGLNIETCMNEYMYAWMNTCMHEYVHAWMGSPMNVKFAKIKKVCK